MAFNGGTSFAAPIVSGLLALAPSPSPLVARLALESSADEEHPGDDDDAKPWAHGLADAAGFVAAHDPSAPPALVLETSGDEGNEQRRGSGDGQLPHPDTTYVAYAFQAAAGVTDNPGTASFSGATADSAAFAAAGDGVYKATLASGDLDPGTASSGGYRLTWTVHNTASLPIGVRVAACSPNRDGVQDRCAWQVGAISGWTIASFVTSGATAAAERAGPGAHTWDGDGASPGGYTLRVLYTEPGGRALLRAFPLVLDSQRPRIADARSAPNPFEPRPRDGDRDTTTFAMTSSERGGCGSWSTATPAPRWSGWSWAASGRPVASGSAGAARPRRARCCGAASPM